MKINLLS